METTGLHKQKLYSLIIAGVGLLGLLLPWISVSMGIFGGISQNGFHGWGILSFLGVLGVVAAVFLGDKLLPFDETFKKLALAGFGALALGAIITLLRLVFEGGSLGYLGIGFWLSLIAGVVGVLWLLGRIKLPDPKKPV